MFLKNHTGTRPVVLSGDRGDNPTYAHSSTFKFFLKDLPIATGRLANYLVGFLVTLEGTFGNNEYNSGTDVYDWDDAARAFFESFELRDSLLGKPISHNFMRGEVLGLASFIGGGMKVAVPQPPPFIDMGTAGAGVQRHSYFVPACSLLGAKGHHTAQLACLFDRATFEIRTPAADVIGGASGPMTIANGTLRVTAILQPDPELRLGPGTQFVLYQSTVAGTQTKHIIEALGQTSSLQNVEEGAGIAALLWLSNNRGLGGSWTSGANIEYVNFPLRGLDQLTVLDALFVDYLAGCDNNGLPHVQSLASAADGTLGDAGPWANNGGLYGPAHCGMNGGLLEANFVPLISPKKFMETSKMQSVQGSVDLYAKHSGAWSGSEDRYLALQYHSWTPAQEEEVLKKIISTGLAQIVWGTNELRPQTKIVNKQDGGKINPAKTRYFARTWAPQEVVVNPPSPSTKA
jgi:hypothetical protein